LSRTKAIAPVNAASGPVRWWLRLTGFDGITLPPFGIFIVQERLNDQRLRRHERAHWDQAQRLGVIRFYARYLWLNLRHGYKNNPMEIEARAAETSLGGDYFETQHERQGR